MAVTVSAFELHSEKKKQFRGSFVSYVNKGKAKKY